MQMQIKIQQSTARFFLYQIASTHQLQASSSFTFGKDLIKHNLVVFRSGEGALQVSKLLNPFHVGEKELHKIDGVAFFRFYRPL